MFTYKRPLQYDVQILNGSKAPAKGFGLVMVKIPKTNIIMPLWPSYYIKKNIKHNNSNWTQTIQSIQNFKSKDLRWLQITTDTGKKLKVETTIKERDQQLLEFITIDVLNIEQQNH